jgi:NitT/TauT family transport system substrate-binding protein
MARSNRFTGAAATLALACAAALAPIAASAQTKVDFILNWVPGGDHAPYYFARKQG